MPITCNGFGGGFDATRPIQQTVAVTQQLISCGQVCDVQWELSDPAFLALVVDALERLAGPTGMNVTAAKIANLTPTDLAQATMNAQCSLQERAIASFDPMRAKALILAQLNNLLCAS